MESYSSFKTYCIFSKTFASFLSGVYPRPELHNTISGRPFPWLNFGVVYRFSCPSTGTEVLESHPCSFLNAPQPQAQHSVHSRCSTNWIELNQMMLKPKMAHIGFLTFGEAFQTELPGKAERTSSLLPLLPSTGVPNPMACQLSNCIIPIPELRQYHQTRQMFPISLEGFYFHFPHQHHAISISSPACFLFLPPCPYS